MFQKESLTQSVCNHWMVKGAVNFNHQARKYLNAFDVDNKYNPLIMESSDGKSVNFS